jgi:hypothetical protein
MSERPNNNALLFCFQTANSSSSQGMDIGAWKWRSRAKEAQLERRVHLFEGIPTDMIDTRGPPTGVNHLKRSKFAITVLRQPVLDR